jgi:general secretion pathway protein I
MTRACMTRGRGFTLIEVLVALAIVAVGMAAVLGTLTSSADTVSYLRDKTFANWVALNQIAQVRLSGQVPATGKSDGDTDFAGRKWHWHQEVTATQVQGMVRIDLSVRPADVDVADSERGWYSTLSGIYGDSLATPRGDLPNWGAQTLMPPTNTPGTNSAAPPGSPPAGPTTPPQPLQPVSPTPGQPSPQPTPAPTPSGTP